MLSNDEEHKSETNTSANSELDHLEIRATITGSIVCNKEIASSNGVSKCNDPNENHSVDELTKDDNLPLNTKNKEHSDENQEILELDNLTLSSQIISHTSIGNQQLSADIDNYHRLNLDESKISNHGICPTNGFIDKNGSVDKAQSIFKNEVPNKSLEILNSISPVALSDTKVVSTIDSEIKKSVSKTAFSSLNNIASKFMESCSKDSIPTTSYSMSDLDKFSEQPFLIGKLKRSTFGDGSSITSDDYDAYDALKKEAASLDESIEGEIQGCNDSIVSHSELLMHVKKLEYDLDVASGSIKHVYEESSKRLHDVSMQYESKIANIDKKFIECIRQKDEVSKSLDECMDARRKLQSNKENLIKSMSNQADENERLRARLHVSTDDCIKSKKELDLRNSEVAEMKKFIKKLQDDLSTLSVKTQWSESKLKSECDAHQLTRTKLTSMDAKIREAKEEADIIRSNCQSIIDKYQNSEEIQSNALGSKLEKLEIEHSDLKQKYDIISSKYDSKCKEFEDVNRKMEQIKDQLFEKDADYRRVLQESKCQEKDKNQLADKLEDLDERLNAYNELKAELKNAYENNQQLDSEIIELRETLKCSEASRSDLNDKEKGNLEYFEKISSKNAELQLEVNSLKVKDSGNQLAISQLSSENSELKVKYSDISDLYSKNKSDSTSMTSDFESKVTELEKCKVDLECQVHDLKNDALVSKRKHQADNKDLIRQIEQFRKQFERQEESMKRSESVNSLESNEKPSNRSGGSSEAEDSVSLSNESGATLSLGNAGTLLVERLCSLQKVLAKRQEKIEFYESHVNTLTRDVQKKSRIIHSLLLRVETGERTKLASDAYKKSQPSDNFLGQSSNGMTLKLSMEINEKLQQVLEDTLFKNITLKENIKTLGDEIDRLNAR